jgi:hypothetical protein
MPIKRYTVIITFLLLIFSPLQAIGADPQVKLPDQLRSRVDFWIKVYTKYSSAEGLIHDAEYPEIIYETIDMNVAEENYSISHKTRRKQGAKTSRAN